MDSSKKESEHDSWKFSETTHNVLFFYNLTADMQTVWYMRTKMLVGMQSRQETKPNLDVFQDIFKVHQSICFFH